MVNYIALVNWTDQGIRDVKSAPERIDAVRGLATKLGCKMGEVSLTIGAYDMVVTMEAPDDETMAKFALTVGSAGNVRTTTLKAFPEDTFRKIVASL